jgi:hypothetical protein
MKFEVPVEKRMCATGKVSVDCDNAEQAVKMVQNQIDTGVLQTTMIEWDEPQYEDCSFTTTDEVDINLIVSLL